MRNILNNYRAYEENPKWENMISREKPLYKRDDDLRSEFERDYTRIIHSNSYRRMKHKTQVIFSPENDHICTRVEHVTHVESISYTIAKYFGLNLELTKTIATAHDLGHSPFGHAGEKILSNILEKDVEEIKSDKQAKISKTLDKLAPFAAKNIDREALKTALEKAYQYVLNSHKQPELIHSGKQPYYRKNTKNKS